MSYSPVKKNIKPSFLRAISEKNDGNWVKIDNWAGSLERTVRNGEAISNTQSVESNFGVLISSDYHDLHLRIEGNTAGNTDITVNPQIQYGVDGQNLRIEGMDSTKTVTLKNGTGLQLNGGNDFIIGEGDIISFIFNKERNLWIETNRSKN